MNVYVFIIYLMVVLMGNASSNGCNSCSAQQGWVFEFQDWAPWSTVTYEQPCSCESGSRLRRFADYVPANSKYFCCPTSGDDSCHTGLPDDTISKWASSEVSECQSEEEVDTCDLCAEAKCEGKGACLFFDHQNQPMCSVDPIQNTKQGCEHDLGTWCDSCFLETVDVVVIVTGVTDSNKDLVCDEFAKVVGGTVAYCSLTGPNTQRVERRRLTTNLYMDITVPDASAAVTTMKEERFIEKVTLALPMEVKPSTVTAKKTFTSSADLIRLTDGVQGADKKFQIQPTNGHGYLQMKVAMDTEWRTVHAEGFGKEELAVACHQLGFPRNAAHTMVAVSLAPGLYKQDKFVDNVRCDVSAQRLQDCTYDFSGRPWREALEVTCTSSKSCPPNTIKENGDCYCKFDRTLLASDTKCTEAPDSSPVDSATTQQSVNMCFMAVLLLLGLLI